ncbi:hypothetical protein DH2020_025878 [Rehmannia glutinosa]|uniref:Serine/threonine-protein kinase BSK1-like TPR repeats domain-containing protein n=1 Tax=Rehmannia glutinosa TaxID=99300 RepID=A0ABR0W298_REHGL
MASDASDALAVREKVQNFLNAARTGNLNLLKKLAQQLDDGKGLAQTVADVKDANKRGALHFAAREGQTEVCKYLVEELKMDVNTKDEDGETPLTHAARQGHTATAKYLVNCGADPSIPSELGTTALHHSAGIGDIELLKFLLTKGVNVDLQSDAGSPLIWAAGHAQQDSVKVLLEHNANPNAKTEDDITPLLSAVAAGSLTCLELLIKLSKARLGVAQRDASASDTIPPEVTTATKMAKRRRSALASLFLEAIAKKAALASGLHNLAGATVNVTAGGATPLHIAADGGNPEIIKCLLKAGADPDAIDEDGWKPIQVAAARGNKVAVEVLFPVTSAVASIPDWSIDGILQHMQHETGTKRGTLLINLPYFQGLIAFVILIVRMITVGYAIFQDENKVSKESNKVKDNASSKQDMPEVTAEAKKKAAEAKARADDAFRRQDFMSAIDAYTQAIDFDPTDATLLSNRSLCWIRLGQAEHALADAKACKALRPDWPKACYREGAALRLLQKFEDAANAFYEGVMLNPENMELVTAFREAVEAGRKFHENIHDIQSSYVTSLTTGKARAVQQDSIEPSDTRNSKLQMKFSEYILSTDIFTVQQKVQRAD